MMGWLRRTYRNLLNRVSDVTFERFLAAVRDDDRDTVGQYFSKLTAAAIVDRINTRDALGNTALIYAARHHATRVALLFFTFPGLQLHIIGQHGRTALIAAARVDNVFFVTELLKRIDHPGFLYYQDNFGHDVERAALTRRDSECHYLIVDKIESFQRHFDHIEGTNAQHITDGLPRTLTCPLSHDLMTQPIATGKKGMAVYYELSSLQKRFAEEKYPEHIICAVTGARISKNVLTQNPSQHMLDLIAEYKNKQKTASAIASMKPEMPTVKLDDEKPMQPDAISTPKTENVIPLSTSFFSHEYGLNKPQRVIFLDVDGVIATPDTNAAGEYMIEADGFINAKLIDLEVFQQLVACAVENKIGLNLLTARAGTDRHIELLTGFIKQAGGFSQTTGGFKEHSLFFSGELVTENGKLIHRETRTKLSVLQEAHNKFYSYLDFNDICIVDDQLRYLTPMQEKNYQVLHVNPTRQLNRSYFITLQNFMRSESQGTMGGDIYQKVERYKYLVLEPHYFPPTPTDTLLARLAAMVLLMSPSLANAAKATDFILKTSTNPGDLILISQFAKSVTKWKSLSLIGTDGKTCCHYSLSVSLNDKPEIFEYMDYYELNKNQCRFVEQRSIITAESDKVGSPRRRYL